METQTVSQKPQPIVTAVNLLWASLAIGLVKMLMDFLNFSTVASPVFTNFVLIFTFALIAFLIFKISAGRNWARIAFLVLFMIGVLPTLPIVLNEFSRSAVVGALSVAQIGLQAYALYLLFTQPGGSWFRKTVHAWVVWVFGLLPVIGVLVAILVPMLQPTQTPGVSSLQRQYKPVIEQPRLTSKPNYNSEGWTQESTGSTEVGPWLNYSPPGTRYYRDANRTIYRVYPPGVMPNAERANPFGLGDSTEYVPQ